MTHPSAAAKPVEPEITHFDAPNDLTTDERNVWLELAPFAFANRTLVKSTGLAFRLLCRNVVLERALSVDVEARGSANHRGMIQRVDAEMLRFNLSPCGKAIYEQMADTTPAANPLERFIRRAK